MTIGASSLASVDGEIVHAASAVIPATDDGFLRGDGAFEVVRLYDGVLFAMDAHVERLERSCQRLRLRVDSQAIRQDTERLIRQIQTEPGDPDDHELLRVVITRGGRRLLLTERLPAAPKRLRLLSTTHEPTHLLEQVKSLSYAANMLASRVAVEAGYDDALLVSSSGRVLEAPRAAIFWVTDGRLQTTPLVDQVLASITRALVIELTGASERTIQLAELYAADEAFLVSTTREVHPITAVDNHEFPSTRPITEHTRSLVLEHIRASVALLRGRRMTGAVACSGQLA